MIKNFIYLDEQKLYSFSSQLFEGVTEYNLNQHSIEETEKDTQKGNLTSGYAIANAVKEASSSTSKKFLHDYSFNLFEAELVNSDLLLDIMADGVSFTNVCNSNKPFIRIRSKGKFVDTKEVQELFKHFNEIGKAIATAQLSEKYQELERLKANNKNSKQIRELQSQLDSSLRKTLAQSELVLPKHVLEGLDTIIENFGDDLVRFQQITREVEFSSLMDRSFFRESVKNICKKYARKTAKEFVVLGTISHSHDTQDVAISEISDNATMLKHIFGLAENLYDIEQSFGSKGDKEIIIEPIAVYTEL